MIAPGFEGDKRDLTIQIYVGFDYWKNSLVRGIKDRLQISVPGESCCVLAVRPVADHPQLISTSRHITQGIVDVMEEKWDAASKTLSGRSKIVGGDPYEVRIVLPDKNWSAASAEVSGGATVAFNQTNELVRATIQSAKSGEVNWTVKFKQATGVSRRVIPSAPFVALFSARTE